MSQRTTIQTLLGATLSISATLPATYDSAGYTATSVVYTALGQVENYGNHGGAAAITKFTPVDTGVVAKSKGSRDYGQMTLMLASVPSDAGQALLATAFESSNRYSVKLTYPLGAGEATAESHYMDVLVSKHEFQDGTVDNMQKLAVDLEICRKPIVVAAT